MTRPKYDRQWLLNQDWVRTARGLHGRIKRDWPLRFKKPATFSMMLAEMRSAELFKELDTRDWHDYCNRYWGRWSPEIEAWEKAHSLFCIEPRCLSFTAGGVAGIKKIGLFAPLCETKEDIMWWGRLGRVCSFAEIRTLVKQAGHTMRCGFPAGHSIMLVGFVDAGTYDALVAPALKTAQTHLGGDASLGRQLAWLCATTLGKELAEYPEKLDIAPVRRAVPGRIRRPLVRGGAAVEERK